MIIRAAEASDIPQMLPMIARICVLHQAWDQAKYGFLPNPEQRYQSWLRQVIKNPRSLCLVAERSTPHSDPDSNPDSNPESDSALVALLIATAEQEIPIYRVKEFGFIHDLWVEEAYRREGIARQLVQRTIAHFHQMEIAQIRLDTAAPNEIARKFFSGCGFRVSMVEMLMEL